MWFKYSFANEVASTNKSKMWLLKTNAFNGVKKTSKQFRCLWSNFTLKSSFSIYSQLFDVPFTWSSYMRTRKWVRTHSTRMRAMDIVNVIYSLCLTWNWACFLMCSARTQPKFFEKIEKKNRKQMNNQQHEYIFF